MLLPLLLLWGVEERLRARELSRQAELSAFCCLPERPVSHRLLVGWLAASAVLLWLLLEALPL